MYNDEETRPDAESLAIELGVAVVVSVVAIAVLSLLGLV